MAFSRKRKAAASKGQDNLKRFKYVIGKFTEEQEEASGGKSEDQRFSTDGKPGALSRKEKRKEGRTLKKMRRLAHRKGSELPTHGSLEKERMGKLKIEKMREKQRLKRKRKRERLYEEKKEKEEAAALEKQEMAIANKQDDRMIKELEKNLKLNKRKKKGTLPQSFTDDGLDYILAAVNIQGMADVEALQCDENSDDEFSPGGQNSESETSEDEDSLIDELEDGDDDNDSDDDEEMENEKTDIIISSESVDPNIKGIIKDTSKHKLSKVKQSVKFQDDKPCNKLTSTRKDKSLNKANEIKSGKQLDIINDNLTSKQKKEKVKLRNDKSKSDKNSNIVSDSESEKEGEEMDESDGESEDEDDDENDDNGSSSSEERDINDAESYNDDDDDIKQSENADSSVKQKSKTSDSAKTSRYSEDIYGRLRDKKGNVVEKMSIGGASSGGGYIPPGKRLEIAAGTDEAKQFALDRLKKQLKGLINRLSESNLQGISGQIEDMYRHHSRAHVSESLTSIMLHACVSVTLTPERLVMEQVMLLAILHSNVGSEVGAVFLQSLARQFELCYAIKPNYGTGKEMDNVLVLLANLYNFKIVHSLLLLDILRRLIENFGERDIELILLLLKNVGFSLRKDDPVSLKEIIVDIQTKAAAVDTQAFSDKSRMKFMLEVLMAIRNNNMRKIPNYDPSHLDHLRKILRNYVTASISGDSQLRISLDDLLNAQDNGRRSPVGSAWTGRETDSSHPNREAPERSLSSAGLSNVSEHILELARKQRMNTDIRKNIFCLIMTAEDFVDAFEKLLRLGLRHQQEQEILHVIMAICMQEKSSNPFYAFLAQKFCEYHRRFQMTIQFSVWDKLKEMSSMTNLQIRNLANFLSHLIAREAMSLSVFKVVEWSELDKHKVKFMLRVFQGLLLDVPDHTVTEVFTRISSLPKLASLREKIKLFFQHFLVKKRKGEDLDLLKERVALAEKALDSAEGPLRF